MNTPQTGLPDAWIRLWTPHRGQYLTDVRSDGTVEQSCPFCAAPNATEEDSLVVFKGKFNCFSKNSIAIVGTRKSTAEGNMISTEIAFDLAKKGINIVSGGAIGIDHAAHHGALIANGATIAVQAAGLKKLYPTKNIETFNKIMENGLLISEYPPNRNANKISFLHRNRIIAALSLGTLVIEAGEISGALSTARYATNLNRILMVIPGSILSKSSFGTNELIRNREAELVTDVKQILTLLSPIGVNS